MAKPSGKNGDTIKATNKTYPEVVIRARLKFYRLNRSDSYCFCR